MGFQDNRGRGPDCPGPPAKLAAASRVRYLVLSSACCLAVVTYLHRVGFAVAAPEVAQSVGLSDKDLGYLGAAFLFAYGAFEVPCGLLGDRFGVRHLLTLLVLGWSLATGCTALVVLLPAAWAAQFSFLFALRFLFGSLQAGAFPSLTRMMADWMPMRERGSAQGLIWMSSRVGGLLSPFVLVPLFRAFGNWETPLWLVAGVGLLWCAAFWPWFRNRPEEAPRVNPAERTLIAAGRAPRSAGHTHLPWSRLFASRSVVFLCLMYGCVGFASNFIVTLMPAYLSRQRLLAPEEVKWLQGLPFAFGIIGCVAGGFFSDWFIRRNRTWGRRVNGLVGLALGAAGWLSINFVDGTAALAVVLCFIVLCNDLNMGPAWAACADIGERYAGTVGGSMNMVGNIVGAVGNVVAGELFQRGHPEVVFALFAGSYTLAALCWLGVDVTKPLSASDPAY